MSVSIERRCENCGTELPLLSRPDRRFCSASCRTVFGNRRRRAERRAAPASPVLAELQQVLAAATEETRLLAVVAHAAGSGSPAAWRAAAWILERQHPERWGLAQRTTRPTLSIDDEGDPFREVDQIAEARRRRESRKPPPGF